MQRACKARIGAQFANKSMGASREPSKGTNILYPRRRCATIREAIISQTKNGSECGPSFRLRRHAWMRVGG
eukprot:scaffold73262_cov32-Tisochrysis_lutea.AAC.6